MAAFISHLAASRLLLGPRHLPFPTIPSRWWTRPRLLVRLPLVSLSGVLPFFFLPGIREQMAHCSPPVEDERYKVQHPARFVSLLKIVFCLFVCLVFFFKILFKS